MSPLPGLCLCNTHSCWKPASVGTLSLPSDRPLDPNWLKQKGIYWLMKPEQPRARTGFLSAAFRAQTMLRRVAAFCCVGFRLRISHGPEMVAAPPTPTSCQIREHQKASKSSPGSSSQGVGLVPSLNQSLRPQRVACTHWLRAGSHAPSSDATGVASSRNTWTVGRQGRKREQTLP